MDIGRALLVKFLKELLTITAATNASHRYKKGLDKNK